MLKTDQGFLDALQAVCITDIAIVAAAEQLGQAGLQGS